MANYVGSPGNKEFADFAGQELAQGINVQTPVIPLEKKATLADIPSGDFGQLMGQLGPTFYRPVKVFPNPLDYIFPKRGMEYGSGFQTVGLKMGPPNKKTNGTCMPRGGVTFTQQLNLENFAYQVDINIKKRLIDKYSRNAEEAANLAALHMSAPAKTIATLRYQTMKQVVADVCDGTRSISSKTASDGTGSTVTYTTEPDGVEGYCGKIDQFNLGIQSPTIGGGPVSVSEDAAFKVRDTLESVCVDMQYENEIFSKQKGFTFSLEPVVIMAEKTLMGIDRTLNTPNEERPGAVNTLSGVLNMAGAQIIVVDKFPAPPTNPDVTGDILAIVIDRETFSETVTDDYAGTFICVEDQRNQGFTYQGASIFAAWTDSPAYCLIDKGPAPPDGLTPAEPGAP